MTTAEVLLGAKAHLERLNGHRFDVIDVAKPVSPEAATNLAKIVSKLSPLVGNLIEFNTCEYLNDQPEFAGLGEWRRQDPGFPDTIFVGVVQPTPGLEVKAWFPLATEITARFKDSQANFRDGRTAVALIAWLPEYLIFGKPKIFGVAVVSAASVARARDEHYHAPPDYIVREPEDTTLRASNLQQSNTNGFKFQGTRDQLHEAAQIVHAWGPEGVQYSPDPLHQARLQQLMGRYPYRLDTNFAKLDRIAHREIEDFKARVLLQMVHGRTIGEWSTLLARGNVERIRRELSVAFEIVDDDGGVVE